MSLIASAKGGGEFIPAPQGVHPGVCVDVVDLGMVDGGWGAKPTCRIVFQLETRMPDGKRFIANRRFTISLSDKSNLLPFLENWRGQKFSQAELDAFDLNNLMGLNGNVQILHNENKGNTYANITAVFPPMPGQTQLSAEGYIRQVDRDKQQPAHGQAPPPPRNPFPSNAQPPQAPASPKPAPSQWESLPPRNPVDDIPFAWIIGLFTVGALLSQVAQNVLA